MDIVIVIVIAIVIKTEIEIVIVIIIAIVIVVVIEIIIAIIIVKVICKSLKALLANAGRLLVLLTLPEPKGLVIAPFICVMQKMSGIGYTS